jgi:hypothetical protein
MAELADPLIASRAAKAGESFTDALGAPDRRRPGRLDQISADLIPLLRTETAQYVDASDALDPARGIAVGLLLSALLWAGLVVIL